MATAAATTASLAPAHAPTHAPGGHASSTLAALATLSGKRGGTVHLGLRAEGRDLAPDVLPTGEPTLDRVLHGGLPRGRITELIGGPSSGKATLLLRVLERALAPAPSDDAAGSVSGIVPGSIQAAALVDPTRSLFPSQPWARGRLLVVRPLRLEDALRALDLLLASAAFAVVGIHLPASVSASMRRLPEAARVRTARLARETGTAVVACGTCAGFGTYAALRVQLAASASGRITASIEKDRAGRFGSATLARAQFPFTSDPVEPQRFAPALEAGGAPSLVGHG